MSYVKKKDKAKHFHRIFAAVYLPILTAKDRPPYRKRRRCGSRYDISRPAGNRLSACLSRKGEK